MALRFFVKNTCNKSYHNIIKSNYQWIKNISNKSSLVKMNQNGKIFGLSNSNKVNFRTESCQENEIFGQQCSLSNEPHTIFCTEFDEEENQYTMENNSVINDPFNINGRNIDQNKCDEEERLRSRKRPLRFKEKNTIPHDFVQLRKFFWSRNRNENLRRSAQGMLHTFDFNRRPNIDAVKCITSDLLPLNEHLKKQIRYKFSKSDDN